ncbi:hypothetical protein EMCG_05935 [[Emmonsia] crescens]|uniref:Aminoglycoside phosphotransferase domain-containing protein n=1 Tax=[Emmonsia] crescens TaxID=73230 RepID=A0A0G2JC22_9EURO|nr:hypothetical protein EMCG_05935 [Emmonsia crescens UAMH 3008]
MVRTRQLKLREVTYSSAKDKESNMLIALTDKDNLYKQLAQLYDNKTLLEQLVAHHLSISPKECKVVGKLLFGSYNICISISIHGHKRMMMRFPILHRVGEFFRPGNADEKIRCEAGTYTWLNENCPSVPVPKLYGFALSTGQTYTAAENLPWLPRYFHYIRCRLLNLFGCAAPSKYIRHQGPCFDVLNAGYLLIEYIDESRGTMLSYTWEDKKNENNLRHNLFKGLSRILLDIAKVPVARIGSFVIDDNGYLVLNNRPLSIEIQELEGKQIPVDIPRDITYSSVDSYITDILAFHDSRFAHQPNALKSRTDGHYQAAALAAMRTASSHFFKRELRFGPFVYVLNDLHQSNILIDEDWNITCLIDLEFACSKPIEMLHPPHWFTSRYVNTIEIDHFTVAHQEFVALMEQQEEELYADATMSVSSVMKRGLENRSFWYSLALTNIAGLEDIFYEHIGTVFAEDTGDNPYFVKVTHKFWTAGIDEFIAKKLKDKAAYDKRLKEEFDVDPDT